MIAISYRREDSSPVTGRLHDRLRAEFGRNNVFMDFDSIPFGVDFRDKIAHTLERARVVVAVVGPGWAGSREGKRRLDDPADFVRMEIAAALQRGIPVIPVLLDNTVMPNAEELPEELRAFAYRNALVLDTGVDFHHHADRLINGIHELLEGRSSGKRKSWPMILGIAAVLALIAAAVWWGVIARQNSRAVATAPITPAPRATEAAAASPVTTATTSAPSPSSANDLKGDIVVPANFKRIAPRVPQSSSTILNQRVQSNDGAVQFAITAIKVSGLAPTTEARAIKIPQLPGEAITERVSSKEDFTSAGGNYSVYHEDVTVEGPNRSYTRYFRTDISTSASVDATSRLWEFWVRDEQALQNYNEIYRAFKKSVKF